MESSSWKDLNTWDIYRLFEYSRGIRRIPDRRNRRVKKRVENILFERKWEFEEFDEQIENIISWAYFDDIEDFINQVQSNEWKYKYIQSDRDRHEKICANIATVLHDITEKIERDLDMNPIMTWPGWSVLPNELLSLYDKVSKIWVYKNTQLEERIEKLVDRYNVPLEERN